MYSSRSYMLISVLTYLFYYLYRQLQVINSFKYVEMEFHHENRDISFHTFKVGEPGLFLYATLRVIVCNFVKEM